LPNTTQPLLGFGPVLVDYPGTGAVNQSSLRGSIEESLRMYVNSSPYYWFDWDGRGTLNSVIPISISIALISFGILAAIRNQPKKTYLYIAVVLAHSLVWAVPRLSGNRFVKTVDWIVLVFFCIGLVEVMFTGLKKIAGSNILVIKEIFPEMDNKSSNKTSFLSGWVSSLMVISLVLMGLSPTVLENLIPGKYSEERLEYFLSGIETADIQGWDDCIQEIDGAEPSGMYYGSAIYPRFYEIGEVHGNDRRRIPQDPTITRVGFYLIGTENSGVVLNGATEEVMFPHRSDVIVVGNRISNYLVADCVFLVEDNNDNITIQTTYWK
jgi:hypothetical protein